MSKASNITLWNKPSSDWTTLPRANVSDKVLAEIRVAIQATDNISLERLDRFNTPVSEETLRSRAW